MEYTRHYFGPLSFICNFDGAPQPADTIFFCIPTRHATAISFLPLMTAMFGRKMIAIDLPGTGMSQHLPCCSALIIGRLISYFLLHFNCKKVLIGHGTGGNLLAWVESHPTILINCFPAGNYVPYEYGWLTRVVPVTGGELTKFYKAYGLSASPLRACIGADVVDSKLCAPYYGLFDRDHMALLRVVPPLLFVVGLRDKLVGEKQMLHACKTIGMDPLIVVAGHMSIITSAEQIARAVCKVVE
jgi:pimeloyl-ACP methyl ester carboxylesterase